MIVLNVYLVDLSQPRTFLWIGFTFQRIIQLVKYVNKKYFLYLFVDRGRLIQMQCSQSIDRNFLMYHLCLVVLFEGKFWTKTEAGFHAKSSTLDTALSLIQDFSKHPEYIKKLTEDKTFSDKASNLAKRVIEWSRTKDFQNLANKIKIHPNSSKTSRNNISNLKEFYGNMNGVARRQTNKIGRSDFSIWAGILSVWIKENKSEINKKTTINFENLSCNQFIGTIDDKIDLFLTFKSNNLKRTSEGKILHELIFESNYGKKIRWITLEDPGKLSLKENCQYLLTAVIKEHQIDDGIPFTLITRPKITLI